jgi:hypothetical protein
VNSEFDRDPSSQCPHPNQAFPGFRSVCIHASLIHGRVAAEGAEHTKPLNSK